jgi:hypothetical protein
VQHFGELFTVELAQALASRLNTRAIDVRATSARDLQELREIIAIKVREKTANDLYAPGTIISGAGSHNFGRLVRVATAKRSQTITNLIYTCGRTRRGTGLRLRYRAPLSKIEIIGFSRL